MASPLELELLKRKMAEIERQAATAPVPSHRPVSTHDVLRTQLADMDRQRMEEMPRGSGPLLTEQTDLNEVLGNLIPGGGGTQQAILPLGSMFRLKEYRNARIAKLAEDMRRAGHGEDYVTKFLARAERNPRLLSQYRAVRDEAKLEGPFAGGGNESLDVPLTRVGREPIFDLHLNTKVKNPSARAANIVHEGTHAARELRKADRARRRQRPDSIRTVRDETRDNMAKEEQQAGTYFDMLDEIAARTNEEFNELRPTPGLTNKQRWQIADNRARDQVRSNRRIEEQFMTPEEIEMKGQMNKQTFADRYQEILTQRKNEIFEKYIKKMFDGEKK